jgi:hypothetical protein
MDRLVLDRLVARPVIRRLAGQLVLDRLISRPVI